MQSYEGTVQRFKNTMQTLEMRRKEVMFRVFEKFRAERLNTLRSEILNGKDKKDDE